MKATRKRRVYLVWGILDAFYITWYCANSWIGGRVPYISDLSSSIILLEQQGGTSFITTLLSWTLQLSIILSCLMFLLRFSWAKYVAYIQTPFRLFYLIPSISLILPAAQLMPGFSLIFLLSIVTSEALKIWSLWKLDSMKIESAI